MLIFLLIIVVNGDSYSNSMKTSYIPTRPSVDSLIDELDSSISSAKR